MSDNWTEYIVLGLDALIFGICSHVYWNSSYSASLVERAHRLGLNPNFDSLSTDDRLYTAFQGEVKALGKPIKSLNHLDVSGVIQRLTIKEHAIARNASGFWSDQKNLIQEAYNVVPFILERGRVAIEIIDPLNAELLDLDTVHNKFETSKMSILDSFVGFFYGIRQRGIETTEEMLKEGSIITAIGEVSKDNEGHLQLYSSSRGYPYYLTSMPITSLLRKLEEQKGTYRTLTYFFGAIGIFVSYKIFKKWWEKRQEKLRDEELKKRLQETRKERRKNVRTGEELSENECCVVCRENPKEIILLPCGHVCICEDCSSAITHHCPICRTTIDTKAAAFIS